MASRIETARRRAVLYEALRQACRDGSLSPGAMLPPVRELAAQYEVTMKVVCEAIAALVEEGLLTTVPRVGTFVGPQMTAAPDYYLFISTHAAVESYTRQIMQGFEERIAAAGGASFNLPRVEFNALAQEGKLPALAGIFELDAEFGANFGNSTAPALDLLNEERQARGQEPLPYVRFGHEYGASLDQDRIHFDDVEGGAKAALHLMRLGHKRIAYLGLHRADGTPGYQWSAMRESGWRTAVVNAGNPVDGLAYNLLGPIRTWDFEDQTLPSQREGAALAAAELVARTDVTAVVAANSQAARGYFDALEHAGIPMESWPAVVCFDEVSDQIGTLLTYLRLPWDETGHQAAQLLVERRTGKLQGPPVLRLVPMKLIPRFSCRTSWGHRSGILQSRRGLSRPSPREQALRLAAVTGAAVASANSEPSLSVPGVREGLIREVV